MGGARSLQDSCEKVDILDMSAFLIMQKLDYVSPRPDIVINELMIWQKIQKIWLLVEG